MTADNIQARDVLQKMKPYSPGKPIWEVQRELGLEKVVKLASNENPLGPSPKAIAAITAALPELHRYPDAQTVDLRQTLAAKYRLEPEQIIVTNGGDELITLVSEAFLEAGDEIVVPAPTFSEYEFGGHLMGAIVKTVPLTDNFQYNVPAILDAITERTKLLYLCSPNNPTGTILLKSQLQQILDALPKQVLVVVDSAYSHYVTSDDYSDGIAFVQAGYPVLVLQTFSKIYGLAGIRVGFGVAGAEIIQYLLQVKEPFNVNVLAQAAASAAAGDEEHVSRSRQLVVLERQRLYGAFRELGLKYTESMTNFILIELGDEAKLLYRKLMEADVIVRFGGTWGLERHVRITVGSPEENDSLIEALRKVLA